MHKPPTSLIALGALALLLASCKDDSNFTDAAVGPDGPDVDGQVDDVIAPQTTITSGPDDPSNSATATFGFEADEDDATFECRVDDGELTPCTSTHEVTVADGPHLFEVRATDLAGNVDATPAQHPWTVDTVPPETTITVAPAALDNSVDVSFEFTASEEVTFECRLDGAAFAPCTTPWPLLDLADGVHTFEVRAIDLAGNVDPTVASHTWTIDSSTPDTVINTGPAPLVNVNTATITFSSPDAGGGASYECRVLPAAFTSCVSPRNLTALPDGSHTFEVRVRDAGNNVDPTPASRTWTSDTTAPVVSSVTSSNGNGTYGVGATITVEVTFSEAVTVVGSPTLLLETGPTDRLATYAGGSGTTTLSFTYSVLPGDRTPDLDYQSVAALALAGATIRDAATNNAVLTLAAPGAGGSLGASKAIVIDAVVPVTGTSSPAAGGTITASGLSSATCTGSGSSSVSCTLDSGVGDVTLTATPAANYRFSAWSNCTTATTAAISFTDASAAQTCVANFVATVPVTATSSPAAGGTIGASAIAGGTCTGSGSSSVSCTLDSGVGDVTLTATAATNYRFSAWSGCSTATTAAITLSNVAAGQACVASFVATVPVVATSSPAAGGVIDATGVSGGTCTGTGSSSVSCTLDSGVGDVTLTAVPAANYRFTAWSNCSTATTAAITLTNVAAARTCVATFVATVPVTATSSPAAGGTIGASAIAGGSCTGSGSSSVSCTLDSGVGDVTLTATPAAGYRFSAWSNCSAATTAAITLTDVNTARTCVASFVATVSVVATSSPAAGGTIGASAISGGSCSGSGSSSVSCGLDSGVGDVTLTATPAANYRFSAWSNCSTATTAAITLTNVASAQTCVANYVATVPVVATASPLAGGTIAASGVSGGSCTGSGGSTVSCTLDSGVGDVTLTATPAANYRFTAWSNCSTATTAAISLANVASGQTCVANFVTTVTVSATSSPAAGGNINASAISGGSCTGSGSSSVSCTLDGGVGDVTLTAVPAANYRFSAWSNCSTATTAAITLTNVAAAQTCVANFVATVPVVATSSPAAGGTVAASGISAGSCSGSGTSSVSCIFDSGVGDVTLTATPAASYRFSAWSNCSTATTAAITLTNVAAAQTCVANFVLTVPVTATSSPAAGGTINASGISGGTCTGSGSSSVSCTLDAGVGDVTLTAVPSANYRFDTWSNCSTATTAAITLSNVPAGRTCVANFVQRVTLTLSATTPTATLSITGAGCAGSSCTVDINTTVTIATNQPTNQRFTSWAGCTVASATASTTTITVTPTNNNCLASFFGLWATSYGVATTMQLGYDVIPLADGSIHTTGIAAPADGSWDAFVATVDSNTGVLMRPPTIHSENPNANFYGIDAVDTEDGGWAILAHDGQAPAHPALMLLQPDDQVWRAFELADLDTQTYTDSNAIRIAFDKDQAVFLIMSSPTFMPDQLSRKISRVTLVDAGGNTHWDYGYCLAANVTNCDSACLATEPRGVAVGPSGEYLVASWVPSLFRTLLISLDRNGNRLWTRLYNGSAQVYDVGPSNDTGGWMVVGEMPSGQGNDAWFMDIARDGTAAYNLRAGSPTTNERFTRVSRSQVDGHVAVGINANDNYYFANISRTGALSRQQSLAGPAFDLATGISPVNDGGYVLSGASSSFNQNYDVWTMRIDNDGLITPNAGGVFTRTPLTYTSSQADISAQTNACVREFRRDFRPEAASFESTLVDWPQSFQAN